MVSLDSIEKLGSTPIEYFTVSALDVYDSSECKALATQAIASRHLRIDIARLPASRPLAAVPILLIEDNYPGWLRSDDLQYLEVAPTPYQALAFTRGQIEPRLPQVIAYAKRAMAVPNEYLWGGTVGPNLDCSGLVQRAYGSQGVWLPRDAYQQEAFVAPLTISLSQTREIDRALEPGDLIFFGPPEKATHVGIYLGEGQYIHSSGKDQGRNCIGIDSLIDLQHPVSQTYARQVRGAGRVMRSYCP